MNNRLKCQGSEESLDSNAYVCKVKVFEQGQAREATPMLECQHEILRNNFSCILHLFPAFITFELMNHLSPLFMIEIY